MMQAKKQAPSIKNLLESSVPIYQNLLGYFPQSTSFEIIEPPEKDQAHPQGLYLPRTQEAVINESNPLSFFHEYFGHGLYHEQSFLGRKLIQLEKDLLKEEKEHFKEKLFSKENLNQFRDTNLTFKELSELKKRISSPSELFSVWSEYFLSKHLGLLDLFEARYDTFSQPEKEIISSLINYSYFYGDLATFYNQGLARKSDLKRAKRLLEDIYKEKLNQTRFALLYGSKKEFSDMDLFVISSEIPFLNADWIDVRVYSPEEFERKTSLFDIALTNPLMTGEFILGDKKYFEESKSKVMNQPITAESIEYNIKESSGQESLAKNHLPGSSSSIKGLNYAQTYLSTALELMKGNRTFEKEKLMSLSNRAPVEGDKPLHLQGGINHAT